MRRASSGSITSTSDSASSFDGGAAFLLRQIGRMRLSPLAAIAGALALACTDPVPPGPLDGTFSLNGHFVGRGQRAVPGGSVGCAFKYDSTAIDGVAAGRILFDSAGGTVTSSSVMMEVSQCDYCLVNFSSAGAAFREGDSVEVIWVGGPSTPILQLLGIYAGDSIAGRIESRESS